jgi:hypothetical protein
MKTNPPIDWRRAALIGLRAAAIGTSHLLHAGGRLLRGSGTVCAKLGDIVRNKAGQFSR